eukprot:604979_1
MSLDDFHIYKITGIVTFVISLLSIFGASYLIITISKKKRSDAGNRDFLLNDYVLYLSVWDVVYHSLYGSFLFSVGFHIDYHWSDHVYLCSLFGFLLQLSCVSSATWSFFIVINLFRLLNGARDKDLKAKTLCVIRTFRVKHNHVIVWLVAAICTLLPLGHYGLTHNPERTYGIYPYECWIVDAKYHWALYGPLAFYIVCSAFVFLWIGCRRCGIAPHGDARNKALENQLLSFSVLFFIVYLFPTIDRIWSLVAKYPRIAFVVLHNTLLSTIGFGNFLIWKFIFPLKTNSIQEIEQSFLSEPDNEKDMSIDDSFDQLVNEE